MSVLVRLWSLRRERPVFVGVAGFVLGFFLAYPAIDWWLRSIGVAAPFEFWDFGAYGAAVNRWQAGGEIYKQKASGSYHQSYLYPPISLLLFWPFVELSNSRIAWNVFSMGVLWVGLQAVLAAMDVDFALPERGLLLWALLGFQPLLLSLKFAQTPAFLTGLLCFSLAALLRGETGRSRTRYASGVFTGALGMVKPSYSTVGAHLLADRDRFLGALGTGVVLLSLSLLVFGIEVHRTYLDVLAWGLHHGDSARSPALWAAPYFKPLFWVPGSLFVRIGASALIAAGALLAVDADREVFALGVVAFPLLSPLTYAYYFVAAIPAVVVMLAVEFERDGRPTIPVVGLFVLSIHSYGLKLVVDVLAPPRTLRPVLQSVPLLSDVPLETVYAILQPGTWGLLLLIAFAAYRVAEAVRIPDDPRPW